MRTILLLSFFFVSPSFEVAAQAETKHLDVPLWFDGCTALSDSHVAFEMDNRCLWNAYDYCEIGRDFEKRRSCIESLSAHIHKETEAIAVMLPEEPAGLSKLTKGTYVRMLERFRSDETEPDCSQMTDFMCKTFGFVSRWSTARQLARMSGVSEGMK